MPPEPNNSNSCLVIETDFRSYLSTH